MATVYIQPKAVPDASASSTVANFPAGFSAAIDSVLIGSVDLCRYPPETVVNFLSAML